MVLGCLAVPKKLRLAFCMFAGVGILVTFSRSSWLLWVIGITGLGLTGQVFFRSKIASIVVLGAVVLLAVYALLVGTLLSLFESLGFDQYLTGGTVSRLGGGGAAFQDASATGRIGAIWHSLSEFQKHPWLGGGLGTTAEWVSMNRPHNLYLMYAVDAGIFGLLLIFALVGILWSQVNSIGRVAVLLYAVSSVFTHNNLEQAHMLCLIAIMIVAYPRRDCLSGESVHYASSKFH